MLNNVIINKKIQFVSSAILLFTGVISTPSVSAGIFTGYESDTENTQLIFVGGQTDSDIFFNFFAANLKYNFLDADTNTEVDNNILNIGLGFNLGNNNNYSFIFGPTYNNKTEYTLDSETNNQSTGAFFSAWR